MINKIKELLNMKRDQDGYMEYEEYSEMIMARENLIFNNNVVLENIRNERC